ncbi:PP2C family serine/threonine-protein phosphatase [Vibrio sp. 10N]|uniref:PP2C family serine/threonine-protein phosphatase n=1 Tax=Vibrio sp. 10N TaxID=3058938 RepID=UPI002812DABF|nr:hypothetical protein VB10N_34540 [Vibrio sp. 10N]
MKVSISKLSVIGPSHVDLSLPNQDAAASKTDRGRWAVAVADGMGSRVLSHIGSKLAVDVAVSSCIDSSEGISDRELITDIYTRWLSGLHLKNIESNDAVTTLLVAWGNSRGEYRFLQLGDGVICSNIINHSVSEDDLFSNETTGLGLSKKLSHWRTGRGKLLQEASRGLVLMTDGISEDIEEHIGFCDTLITRAQRVSLRATKKQLKGLLNNWPTPHHTDDKTIAVVLVNE